MPDVWDVGRLRQRQSFHVSLWFSVSFLTLLIYLLPYISSFVLLSLFFMLLYRTCSLFPSWAQIFLSCSEIRAQVPTAMRAVILTGCVDTYLAEEIIKK